MEESLVTIITITYNIIENGREESLRKSFDSVHMQTYKNIEHLVIDGNSNDGTLNLLNEYSDLGFIKYISEPDNGIYDAMNKGVFLSKGKYIAFLNSDDFYHSKEGVEKTVNALEESNADFSYAPVLIRFEDGKLFSDHPQCNPKISNIFFTMPFSHQTMFAKRDVILKENSFNTEFRSAGDYDLIIRLCLKKYKPVFVDFTFVTYLFAGVSSVKQEESIREIAKLWKKNFESLCVLSPEDIEQFCTNIYTGRFYEKFPDPLAEQLKSYKPFFDYDEYLRAAAESKKQHSIKYNSIISVLKKILNILIPPRFKQVLKKYYNFRRQ